jgi:hypothetical protein
VIKYFASPGSNCTLESFTRSGIKFQVNVFVCLQANLSESWRVGKRHSFMMDNAIICKVLQLLELLLCLLRLRTDDTNKKKSMPGLIYIFWHIFIGNYINNKFLKYQEFVNLLWYSKLYFSPISYICPYQFLSLYLPFVWKIEWKIKICKVNIIHFININRTLVVIFMILEKSL